MHLRGSQEGHALSGVAWVEQTGYVQHRDMGSLLTSVFRETRRAISEFLSPSLSREQVTALVGARHRQGRADGVDAVQLARSLVEPLLTVIDRGGKTWRSFGALACIDAVGGDSRKFTAWLAMPELIHVGSLIVDDVQDGSEIRRGGKTAHLLYGVPLSINAGNAAYFIAEQALSRCRLTPYRARRISDLYFDAMRAGHAGQAIDIDGLYEYVPAAVESGDMSELEQRVQAVNRLKTAVPAGTPARMGAVAGGGSEEQVEGLGGYFESVGMAFQIVDDVLNLRGFKGDRKQRGEDVRIGKVTLPIIKALGRLPHAEREFLWNTLRSKPQEDERVEGVLRLIEQTGALEACLADARELVEQAWWRLEPLIPDSLSKLWLRAFGWFVLERSF
jgi:geranylgeranyl pyrophosphate synthase